MCWLYVAMSSVSFQQVITNWPASLILTLWWLQHVSFFSECKFVRIYMYTEVLVERSIFADVFHHLVSLNWKLTGSMKGNVHHSIWNKTTKAVIKGLKCYFQDLYLLFLFKIKPWECLLINHINNFVILGVDWWIVVYFFPQHNESSRIRKFVITGCGCTLVVKCHNGGSCIQGLVVLAS